MADASSHYDILLAIRAKLDDLDKTIRGIKGTGSAIDEVNAKSSRLGETFKAVFGANVAERLFSGIAAAAKEAAFGVFSLASEIRDGAENLEMSARGFQVLRQVVRDAGGDVGSMTMAVSSLNRSIVEARDVASGASAAFEKLDLNPAELESMDVEHRLEAVAKAIAKAQDRMGAFSAAGTILGERAIPRLRGALNQLADEGYDALATKIGATNRLLGDDEIARLDAAAKARERFLLSSQIFIGNKEADVIGIGLGDTHLPGLPKRRGVDEAQGLRDQQRALLELRAAFEDAARAEALFQNDPNKSVEQKRANRLEQLNAELDLLYKIIEARKAMPLDSGETRAARAAELAALGYQYLELGNQLKQARGDSPGALTDLRDRAAGLDKRRRNAGALTIGEGFQAGVLQWMEQLGSRGEQVAGVIQEGIGGAVSAVSAKLAGGDVRSWGEVWRGVLQSILQQMIQIALQMQIMRLFMGVFDLGSAGVSAAAAGNAIPLASGYTPLAGASGFNFTAPHRALGGDVEVGQIYNINEDRVPEVFIPRVPGRISPHGGTALVANGGRGAGGGVTVQQTINVSTGVQETVRAEIVGLLPALRSASVDGVRDAVARGELEL